MNTNEIRACPCTTCKKECHSDYCGLSRNSNCKNCGKPLDLLEQHYMRTPIYNFETGCCSKECYFAWRENIDKFEKDFTDEIRNATISSLIDEIEGILGIEMEIRMFGFMLEEIML